TGTAAVKVLKDSVDALSMNLLQHFDGMEGFENTVFKSSAEYLLKEGVAFDLISDKQLQQVQSVNNKLLTGGVHYQTILLSDCKYITVETMEKLVNLAKAGATVIFHKNFPAKVPGYSQLEKKTAALQKLLLQIHFDNTGNAAVSKAAIAKGVILKGDDLDQLLSFAKIRRENMVKQELLFVRRTYENGNVYFISNSSDNKIEAWVPLSVKATGIALFDPMTGRSGIPKTRKTAGGYTEVFLSLAADESCIVQTSAAVIKATPFPYIVTDGEPRELKGSWEIKFTDGGPTLPATVLVNKTGSWTDIAGDEVKKFSGTAQYSISLKRPAGNPKGWLLNLGKVQESAEVLLNGKKLAILIGPEYQLVIPASILKADNLLQINVSNSMANRIADLDKRGVEWKKFYNVNFPSRLAENRNASGIFDASKWKPEPSGLIGPVTLTPVK
ncbi:MAG: glycosylhydrolase-like jelly roll fold domain-containing protein, partial [Bacteroidota bacterium]